MGSWFSISEGLSILKDLIFDVQSVQVLIAGVDGAGKSTIVSQLKLGELSHKTPTIGSNSETVYFRNIRFIMFQFGHQLNIRSRYYFDTQAIIFVVDATDKQRFQDAREDLQALMNEDQLQGVKFLVFNNKSDMTQAVSTVDVAIQLGLTNVKGREWCMMTCSAKTGEGIFEGLEKLHLSLTGKKAMNGEIG